MTSAMSDEQTIADYVRKAGFEVTPCYFDNSCFTIGYRTKVGAVRIAWRLQGRSIIVFELLSESGLDAGLLGDFGRALRFLRWLSGVPGIAYLQGLVLHQGEPPEVSARRRRLVRVLVAHGAAPRVLNGNTVLRFEARAQTRARAGRVAGNGFPQSIAQRPAGR